MVRVIGKVPLCPVPSVTNDTPDCQRWQEKRLGERGREAVRLLQHKGRYVLAKANSFAKLLGNYVGRIANNTPNECPSDNSAYPKICSDGDD
jgi:hypothetical protein